MKFCGVVGYCEPVEKGMEREGIWDDNPIERKYYGDVLQNRKRWDANSESVLDNMTLNNQISIVADAFAFAHFFAIKYVSWMGTNWKVTSVEVKAPRLILTIGGVYNGPTGGTASGTESPV